MKSGQIKDLGDVYERSEQGWYIPQYMINVDQLLGVDAVSPDLQSVFDLPQYSFLFSSDEHFGIGVLINCIGAWYCSKVNEYKLHAYGLDEYYVLFSPDSAAELDELILKAYRNGRPILTYYWEPNWLLGSLDMIKLDEPSYNEACWLEINQAIENNLPPVEISEMAGCAFETRSIRKLILPGLENHSYEVV